MCHHCLCCVLLSSRFSQECCWSSETHNDWPPHTHTHTPPVCVDQSSISWRSWTCRWVHVLCFCWILPHSDIITYFQWSAAELSIIDRFVQIHSASVSPALLQLTDDVTGCCWHTHNDWQLCLCLQTMSHLFTSLMFVSVLKTLIHTKFHLKLWKYWDFCSEVKFLLFHEFFVEFI